MNENEEKKEIIHEVDVVENESYADKDGYIEENSDKYVEYAESEVVTGTYTTGHVAEATGVSRDMVRYYIREFDEFLNVQKTKGGHNRIGEEDYELLKNIIHLAKTGKQIAEIKVILEDPNTKILYGGKSQSEQFMLQLIAEGNKQLLSSFQRMIVEMQDRQNRLLLEQHDKDETDKETLRKEIEELREQIRAQNELMSKKELENALTNEQLREQMQKQEELLQKIAEQTNKKRFFWQK